MEPNSYPPTPFLNTYTSLFFIVFWSDEVDLLVCHSLFTERSFVTIVTMVTYQSHLTGIFFFFFIEPPSRLSRDCNVQQVRLQLRHTGRIVLPV